MGVQDQAIMEIVSGASEPSALLPFQMPANMSTVEKQFEDVPRDMECYTDSEGNVYDFALERGDQRQPGGCIQVGMDKEQLKTKRLVLFLIFKDCSVRCAEFPGSPALP